MDKIQVTNLIKETYSYPEQAYIMRVICKDDITFYGYFSSFDDFTELEEKNQYRFIPRNNVHSFKNDYSKNGAYDRNHSIILNGEDIINMEFVLPLHI